MKDLEMFPMELLIEVTDQMIAENHTWSIRNRPSGRCATCPIARATNQKLCIGDEDQPYALVSGNVEIVGSNGSLLATYRLPDGAIKFIGAADAANRGEKLILGMTAFQSSQFVLERTR